MEFFQGKLCLDDYRKELSKGEGTKEEHPVQFQYQAQGEHAAVKGAVLKPMWADYPGHSARYPHGGGGGAAQQPELLPHLIPTDTNEKGLKFDINLSLYAAG